MVRLAVVLALPLEMVREQHLLALKQRPRIVAVLLTPLMVA